MSRVFISHSSANNAEALALRDWMVGNGWDDLFLDLDPQRGLKAGERWQAALKKAAERCELVLFVVSPVWAASKWCLAEYLLATNLNKRVIGVIVEPTPFEDLPTEMTAEWQLIDLTAGARRETISIHDPLDDATHEVSFGAEGLGRLRIGLMRCGLDPTFFPWPPEDDPERPPYRGLQPLEAEDAGIFFGRAGPIVLGTDMLRGLKDAEPPRLAVILGASGAGKSSFMRAGLLPRLAREEQHFLPLPVIRPDRAVVSGDTGVIASLELAFRQAGIPRKRADIRAAVAAGVDGLLPLLDELVARKADDEPMPGAPAPKRPTLILPIDQAEELFLADGAGEADAFLRCLGDIARRDQPACIALFTIRSDHYEHLQTARQLEGLRQRFLSLPPMPQGAFAEVIRGPAHRLEGSHRQLTIEDQLVDALLADVETGGAKDALPLLAFTLERLYREHGGSGELRLEDYEELGGIKGSIEAAVERALQLADGNPSIPRDRRARLELLRHGLVPWLASVDPDSGAPRRRIARVSEIPPESLPLLELLVEQRLLATDVAGDTGEVTIEPAHEALLRQWGLLEGWLEEDFEDLATLEGIRRAARDWAGNDRDDDWITHSSGRLESAERVVGRHGFAAVLAPAERAYLEAARAAENLRKEAAFAQLKRDRRRSRIIAIGAAGVALTMGLLGWVMYGQWQNALRTESLFLADLSHRQIEDGDPVTALLLALEALDDRNADRLAQSLRPHVPAALGALDSAIAEGRWHDRLMRDDPDAVTSVAISADGGRVLTGSIDMTARVWDADTGEEILTLRGHTDRIFTVAISADGRRMVSGSNDGTARVWDENGRLVRVLAGHEGRVLGVAISADGARVVTGGEDGTARLWDAASGEVLTTFEGHRSAVSCVGISADGRRVATGSWDRTARVWDAGSGAEIISFDGHTDAIRAIAISADGTRLVTGSRDKTARLYDVPGRALVAVLEGHTDAVFGVALSADGSRVVTGSWDKTVRLWNGRDGALATVLKGHSGIVRSVAVSADGARVVSGSWDKTTRVWDPAGGRYMAAMRGGDGPLVAAMFSADGHEVVTVAADHMLRKWDAGSGREDAAVRIDESMTEIRSAAMTPDGSRIATGHADGTARLWDASAGQVGEFGGHAGPIGTLAITADGEFVVTGSDDGTVRMWEAASGREIATVDLRTGHIYGLAVTPDSRFVVIAADDPMVRLWEPRSGAPPLKLAGHSDAVYSVAATPDASHIVTGSKDKTVMLWRPGPDGVPGTQVVSGADPVLVVAISPDGKWFATGSDDGTTRLWDALSGQPVAEYRSHSRAISGLAFAPDGSRLASASRDGTARVWRGPGATQATIDRGKEMVTRCLTEAQRRQFHLTTGAPRWCYEMKKWPYEDIEMADAPGWMRRTFADAVKWLARQAGAVQQAAAGPD